MQVIQRANHSEYGLAAGVFTKDVTKSITVANALEAGTVWVNYYHFVDPGTPFGKIFNSVFYY